MRIETQRLVLREWREADRAPLAALNADAEVMRFMPSTMTRDESDAFFDRMTAHLSTEGFGLWPWNWKASSSGSRD
jgi:RimJ/RimL family protein N-acetyltransferase